MKPFDTPPGAPGDDFVAPRAPHLVPDKISGSVPALTPVGAGKPADAGPPDPLDLPEVAMERIPFLIDEEEDHGPGLDIFG